VPADRICGPALSVAANGHEILLAFSVPADIYVVLLQVVQPKRWEILSRPGVPADIYFLLLEAVQLTGMRYYPTLACQPTYMWAPLQAVQLTALNYYPASGCQADISAPSSVIIIWSHVTVGEPVLGPPVSFCP